LQDGPGTPTGTACTGRYGSAQKALANENHGESAEARRGARAATTAVDERRFDRNNRA